MANGGWKILVVLAAAQFLMVLDQAVMNVSISQLVEDFDTEVTTIQAVITLYSLVMAALMITGGKLGDIIGRRRAFGIGHGDLRRRLAAHRGGLERAGPARWAGRSSRASAPRSCCRRWPRSSAGNFEGDDRALAYGVLGGLAGAGIAVGPLLGGWVTT